MPTDYVPPSRAFSAAIYGPAKTGKSYFALTFPKPMVIVETDPLSFDRAYREYRKSHKDIAAAVMGEGEKVSVLDYDIFLYHYPLTLDNHTTGEAQRFYNTIAQRMLDWMMLTNDDGTSFIKTVVVDTGDILWDNLGNQRLERAKQVAAVDGKTRRQLNPFEYGPCNAAMTTFYRFAKTQGVHFVTTHGYYPEREIDFETKELIVRSKQEQCRGWKQTPQKADMMFMTSLHESIIPGEQGVTFEAEVTSTGEEPLKIHGQKLSMPTFDKVWAMLG